MAEILVLDPPKGLVDRLIAAGHRVLVAADAAEGVELALQCKPALALCPESDRGLALVDAASAVTELERLPVVAVAGPTGVAAALRTHGLVAGLLADNAVLERAAHRDALTALHNRYSLEERFGHEALVAARYGTPFAVIMADIDRFKDINDRFGHQIGDLVLCAVADCFRERVRDADILGRWGGEEFMIILPHTEIDGARVLAERLRSALHEESVAHRGQRIRFSASFGAAAFRGGDPFEVIERADQALYAAKRGGRDRVATLRSDLRRTQTVTAPSPA